MKKKIAELEKLLAGETNPLDDESEYQILMTTLKEQNSRLHEELGIYKRDLEQERLSTMKIDSDKIVIVKDHYDQLKTRINELEKEVKAHNDDRVRMQKEIDGTIGQISREGDTEILRKRIRDLAEELRKKDIRINALITTAKKLDDQIIELKKQIEKQIAKLPGHYYPELQEKIEKLQKRYDLAEEEVRLGAIDYGKLRQEKEKVEQELLDFRTKMSDMLS